MGLQVRSEIISWQFFPVSDQSLLPFVGRLTASRMASASATSFFRPHQQRTHAA